MLGRRRTACHNRHPHQRGDAPEDILAEVLVVTRLALRKLKATDGCQNEERADNQYAKQTHHLRQFGNSEATQPALYHSHPLKNIIVKSRHRGRERRNKTPIHWYGLGKPMVNYWMNCVVAETASGKDSPPAWEEEDYYILHGQV